jgi:FtsP/CotA-like multicopper oxidase with cupredoxin domain
VHWADTVLLGPKDQVEVAFVADNPGDWMLHCHIIEHQETGMMGYVRVA